jgi:hypothetical protein
MIVSIVTFKLPKRWTVDEAAAVFKSTAPKYLGKPGLVRKHYYVTEYGAAPDILYANVPVSVDNIQEAIEA